MKKRVIIDTDPGTDDAIAILLALNSPELVVEAITVVPGNVVVEQGLTNALRILGLANRPDIPVAGGARRPLGGRLITAGAGIHGPEGLGNSQLAAPRCAPDPRFAPDLIVELIRANPHEITLVGLGPLTNLALALSRDPTIGELVKEVILMGGSIAGGNVTAAAEFNIYVDPEAARAVFRAGWPLTMVGLEIGWSALFRSEHLERLQRTRGPQNDFAADILAFLLERSRRQGSPGTPIYDATAMAAVIDPALIRTEHLHVDVELRGELTRGQTVVNRRNAVARAVRHGDQLIFEGTKTLRPNIHVAVHIDAERFRALLIDRLSGN
ncbi:MAG: nucleoside hydrolase [Acidobacteriota bacterium]